MKTATVTIKDSMEEAQEQLERQRALALLPDTAVLLHQDVEQIGAFMMKLGKMVGAMQQRLDDLEARQAHVTISHADARRLQALIRMRADVICEKNGLQDPDSRKIFRAAIKRDVLRRANVKDLHDLPAARLDGTERQIDSWTSIRLVMERRGKHDHHK